MADNTVTRREFLRVSAIVAAGSLAAACGGPQATQAPEPTAAPAAPTQAPPAQPTMPAALPTETPAPAMARYNEAPMLAELVQAGKLPPVEERLPAEPMVLAPTNVLGKYGGTLYGGSTSPDTGNDLSYVMIQGPFSYSNDLSVMYPNVAESYEFNEDATRCTIYLRQGIRWSDGAPFSADDVMFYFEDIQFNTDLSPTLSSNWKADGQPMTVTKVDDYTVQLDFAGPKPGFGVVHFSFAPTRPWSPKHYMSQFHIKYNPKAEEEAKAQDFNNWQARFSKHNALEGGRQVTERPRLEPWVPVTVDSEADYYERNPYYWKVDPEGNQLPYVDFADIKYGSLEVTNMRAISGELSALARDLLLVNYPLMRENQEKGDYYVFLGKSARTVEGTITFNQNHKDPVMKQIFNDVRFRQAMSVAIDREEINELLFLGQGTPLQAVCHPSCSFYREEWGQHYAQHDPDLANQLLDELGLDKRGPDGMRLRPDGQPFSFLLEYVQHHGPNKEQCELVVKHWAEVGVRAEVKENDKSFMEERLKTSEQDASQWMVDRSLERSAWCRGGSGSKLGPGGDSVGRYCRPWQDYYHSGGAMGVEPPPEAYELWAAFDAWERTMFGSPEYMEAAVKVHDLIAKNLWVIGLVGAAPWPILVKNKLGNVFTGNEEVVWIGASNWYLLPQRAEQWFWKD